MDGEMLSTFRGLQKDTQARMPGDWKINVILTQGFLPNQEIEACTLQLQAISTRHATVLEGSPGWLVKMALHYDFDGAKS